MSIKHRCRRFVFRSIAVMMCRGPCDMLRSYASLVHPGRRIAALRPPNGLFAALPREAVSAAAAACWAGPSRPRVNDWHIGRTGPLRALRPTSSMSAARTAVSILGSSAWLGSGAYWRWSLVWHSLHPRRKFSICSPSCGLGLVVVDLNPLLESTHRRFGSATRTGR